MARELIVEASSAKTVTGNGSAAQFGEMPEAVSFELDVTAAAAAVGDTLDVFVQTQIGGNWVDVVHFTQALGNGGAKRFVAKIVGNLTQSMYENAAALAAGSVRNIVGVSYRARWVIAGATPNFTFSVKAIG